MTRSLSLLATLPWPIENIDKIVRGDYLNTDVIFDLTLSRLGDGLLNGTRFEGDLTELEMQWGTDDRPAAEPVHRGQSAGRSLPVQPGALTC